MHILLTQPLVSLVLEPPHLPDLGLGYLASSLQAAGHAVHVRDWNAPGDEASLLEDCRRLAPGLVGVKVFTKDTAAAMATVRAIRRALSGTRIILGGPHPSCAEPAEVMADFPELDYAFRGEAEAALPALASLLEHGSPDDDSLAAIPGLVWRSADGVRANPPALTRDLPGLPQPAWDLLAPESYNVLGLADALGGAAAPIITTRGCPGACSFCSAWMVSGKRIRFRDPEEVVDEMRRLQRDHGVKSFMIMDNCFTSSSAHFTGICETMLRENIQATWDCCSYERLDHLTEETVSLMHRAGCRMLHLGIESAAPRIRTGLQKHCSLEDYRRVTALCNAHGIAPVGWFILGFPDESLAEMHQTLRFAFSLDLAMATVTPCYPLPGSQVYQALKAKHGLDRLHWDTFDTKRSPWPMHQGSTARRNRLLKLARLGMKIMRRSPRLGRLYGRLMFPA
ncbi:B12-binding domain-containing radical SAM protein [Megalodesulfovibrio gigas]|uniref:Putative radical SAM domain-containing protein n=1 Tax=Megalodesulfovibrio gigas (strain ATCC 19364 / DSM 1382 / NCIMB 9332 / VKM B-1759) TaxID=1121448 RepID=T2GBT8_MEGG1|nr:B12-binding domain-containing radical SAM protein [Megalodesulfovibrio gigas]AGW13768.1 putative radical SAM domain-containing protein [Megalodesulfovibrio gigas DSM 1382 = ATCC 19364]